jgi:hypothetical protein
MMLIGCKSASSLLLTLVGRDAWCWSAANLRSLAFRKFLGEIPVVGLPKPFTSGE